MPTQEVRTPDYGGSQDAEYVTRAYKGKAGNLSMQPPGGGSLNRRSPAGASAVAFQKARKQRK